MCVYAQKETMLNDEYDKFQHEIIVEFCGNRLCVIEMIHSSGESNRIEGKGFLFRRVREYNLLQVFEFIVVTFVQASLSSNCP